MNPSIEYQILDDRIGVEVPHPQRETTFSAGFDLRAMINEPLELYPGQTELIPSGIAINIADPTLAGMILPRSGLGHKKGLVLGNGVGLIDADYQGQLYISAHNRHAPVIMVNETSYSSDGNYAVVADMSVKNEQDTITINPCDRIAQLVIFPVAHCNLDLVTDFTTSDRGDGGFGHTGQD